MSRNGTSMARHLSIRKPLRRRRCSRCGFRPAGNGCRTRLAGDPARGRCLRRACYGAPSECHRKASPPPSAARPVEPRQPRPALPQSLSTPACGFPFRTETSPQTAGYAGRRRSEACRRSSNSSNSPRQLVMLRQRRLPPDSDVDIQPGGSLRQESVVARTGPSAHRSVRETQRKPSTTERRPGGRRRMASCDPSIRIPGSECRPLRSILATILYQRLRTCIFSSGRQPCWN